jgi:predicted dehydrogenase
MKVMKMNEKTVGEREACLNRRDFVGAALFAGAVLAACGSGQQPLSSKRVVPGPKTAPEGQPLKAGLIGCGGRGTGAAQNFLDAGQDLEIVALADIFEDRLQACRERLKDQCGVEVADDHCFLGFDAYKGLLETEVDVVLHATPPHFRPEHFEAAVRARKHVFMEKPVAVDPIGVRSVLASAERADALGLCVVTGTQFRHTRSFIETYNRVQEGMIGEIVAARGYSLRGQLWYKTPQKEWTEMEAMLRDWVNWQWLSGDFIVEQHIHGLDVMFWFIGEYPVKAVAIGGRARRPTGDQYDFFGTDYALANGVHVNSMCRQIDGCTNNISRFVIGTQGYTNCEDTIWDHKGTVLWQYKVPEGEEDNPSIVQEHIDLVTAIRTENHVNTTVDTANSTLAAVMGRESAYSGLEVTWDEVMQSDQRLGPKEYVMGPVNIEAELPVPGVQEPEA